MLYYRLKKGLTFVTDGETAYKVAALKSDPFESPEKFVNIDELYGCVKEGSLPIKAITAWFKKDGAFKEERIVRPVEGELKIVGFAEELTPEKLFLLLEEYPGLYRTLRDQGYKNILSIKREGQEKYIFKIAEALSNGGVFVRIENEFEDKTFRRIFSINNKGVYSNWTPLSVESRYREDADPFTYFVTIGAETIGGHGRRIFVSDHRDHQFPTIKFNEIFKVTKFYQTGYNVGHKEGYNECREKELQPLKCELEGKIKKLEDDVTELTLTKQVLEKAGIPVPEIWLSRSCSGDVSVGFKCPLTGRIYWVEQDRTEKLVELYKSVVTSIFEPDMVVHEGELKRHIILHEVETELGYGAEWLEAVCVLFENGTLHFYYLSEFAEIGDCGAQGFDDFGGVDEVLKSCPDTRGEKVLEIPVESNEPIKLKFSKTPISLPILEPLGEFGIGNDKKIYVYRLP